MGKRTHVTITTGMVRRMQEMRNGGSPARAIAAAFGCNPTTVRNHTISPWSVVPAMAVINEPDAEGHLEACLNELRAETDLPPNGLEAELKLTKGEARILGLLMKHPRVNISKEKLAIACSYDKTGNLAAVDSVPVLICHIRKKLAGSNLGAIENFHGYGYRWVPAQ